LQPLAFPTDGRIIFYVFDLLYLDDFDLRDATLIERKEVLVELLATIPQPSPVLYSEHLEEEGPQLRERECRMPRRHRLEAQGRTCAPIAGSALLELLPYRKCDVTRSRDEPMHRYFAGHGCQQRGRLDEE
jgi:hypothetical protein